MNTCMNFDRRCGPHHFCPGMDHFRRHHPYGGHPHWNFWNRGREGPWNHGGPQGFPHPPPPFMFMGDNRHHRPHHFQPDQSRFQENRSICHHCRRNNDRPRPQQLPRRPLSCPPFDRPSFNDGPFDRSRRGREPSDHLFERNCCHLSHGRERINRGCEHCGNPSTAL